MGYGSGLRERPGGMRHSGKKPKPSRASVRLRVVRNHPGEGYESRTARSSGDSVETSWGDEQSQAKDRSGRVHSRTRSPKPPAGNPSHSIGLVISHREHDAKDRAVGPNEPLVVDRSYVSTRASVTLAIMVPRMTMQHPRPRAADAPWRYSSPGVLSTLQLDHRNLRGTPKYRENRVDG